MFAPPKVRGAESSPDDAGTVWRASGATTRAVVVCLSTEPRSARWLAASLAVRLDAVVALPRQLPAPDEIATTVVRIGGGGLPLAIVGEADAAPAAIEAARASGARLALISPRRLDGIDPVGIPTTLIQAAADGDDRAGVERFERALRGAGVAVRETDYSGVADGWTRRPGRRSGSKQGLDDLVAFLDRGIGQASTFDVIPGWDLH